MASHPDKNGDIEEVRNIICIFTNNLFKFLVQTDKSCL